MYSIRDVFTEAYLLVIRLWRQIHTAPRCIWKGCDTTNAMPWKSLQFVSRPTWLRSSRKSEGLEETCTCVFIHISVTLKPVIYSLHIKNHRIKRGHIQLQTCVRNLAFDINGVRANRIIWEVRRKCFQIFK